MPQQSSSGLEPGSEPRPGDAQGNVPGAELPPGRSAEVGRVLVVAHPPENVAPLQAFLRAGGHEVLTTTSGEAALRLLVREKPDLLLLDATMPEMSGLEVARRARADPQSSAVPILIMTALQGEEERARAIEAGADDFVGKPVSHQELLARVRSLLRIGRLQSELIRRGTELADKATSLEAAERARDDVTSMLVHDLRSPLNTLLMSLQYLRMSGLTQGQERAEGILARAESAGAHMMRLIEELLDLSKLRAGQMEPTLGLVDVPELLGEVVDALAPQAERRGVRLVLAAAPDLTAVTADHGLLERVFLNLLENAIKFAPSESDVRLAARARNGTIRIEVHDHGPGVPPEDRTRIFEKFGRSHSAGPDVTRSSGLGLAFCKLAVERHGGRIGVEAPEEGGSLFFVELPLAGPTL